MSDNKNVHLELFKKSGAVLKGHFLLTSGRHSDTYMQCARLFVEPSIAEPLCAALADKIKAAGIGVDIVASPALGGVIMGYIMAKHLGVPNVFAERKEKDMELRRGFEIKPGQRVLVVEDVVTTGGSVREVVDLVRAAGGIPAAVAVMVDRSNGKVDFSVPFVSLLSMDVPSYEADNCPLCKEGGLPPVKPGSRKA